MWIIYIHHTTEKINNVRTFFLQKNTLLQRKRAVGMCSGKNTALKHPSSGHEMPERVTHIQQWEGSRHLPPGQRSALGMRKVPRKVFPTRPYLPAHTPLTLLLLNRVHGRQRGSHPAATRWQAWGWTRVIIPSLWEPSRVAWSALLPFLPWHFSFQINCRY